MTKHDPHGTWVPRTPEDLMRVMEEHIPFNRLLGLRGESIALGRCVLTLAVREEFIGDPRRPALHGGVVSSLIDTAGGLAAWSALPPGESVSTVDLRVDYLEPAGLGAALRASAALVRKGNRVCHVRIEVTQGDVLVADGRGVYNIHRRSAT
ncbi:MAG TPA: hotdog fold thioesterase [Vicinamibacteria bacterium]|nr:hotdog fold thioesterase [Vicinamibacteria bacterium]